MKGQATVKMSEPLAAPERDVSAQHRVALVTGGGRGIGAATAAALAAGGCFVVVNYRADAGSAEAVVRKIQESGGQAAALAADLSQPGAGADLVRSILESRGSLDVIVHAASPALDNVRATELNPTHLDKYFDVYVRAAVDIVHAAVPSMTERGFGRIVMLGTSAMHEPPPAGWGPYLTAKWALWGLVRTFAQELGAAGITTNMVSPSLTVTELTANVSTRAKEVEARRNPMRRLATPEDTASMIAFLAGPSAGFVNGSQVSVTGAPE